MIAEVVVAVVVAAVTVLVVVAVVVRGLPTLIGVFRRELSRWPDREAQSLKTQWWPWAQSRFLGLTYMSSPGLCTLSSAQLFPTSSLFLPTVSHHRNSHALGLVSAVTRIPCLHAAPSVWILLPSLRADGVV